MATSKSSVIGRYIKQILLFFQSQNAISYTPQKSDDNDLMEVQGWPSEAKSLHTLDPICIKIPLVKRAAASFPFVMYIEPYVTSHKCQRLDLDVDVGARLAFGGKDIADFGLHLQEHANVY